MITSLVWMFVQPALAGDGVEISRSKGRKEGVVVLYPRVVPATDDAAIVGLAARLQEKVAATAGATFGLSLVDVRPAPERVCPHDGCRGQSVSLMIGHQSGGCVVVAVVGPPGATDQIVVPIAGELQMVGDGLAYRSPPESKFIVREFVPCVEVEQAFDAGRLLGALTGPAIEP